MDLKFKDKRSEKLFEKINYQLISTWGNKINISSIKEINKNNFQIIFDYNNLFHIIDKKTKTIHVKNIHFNNIYSKKIKFNEQLTIPIIKINKNIYNEFKKLRS